MTNVQRTVDAYASMGLPALEKMKRTNPKLLAAIAQENLEQTVAASGNNKAMAMGGAKPTVTDRKLGLAGLPGLGQQEALGAAAPGIRQRGRQLQANQLARAMQQNVRRPAGGITSMPLMRSGMRMAGAAGGAVGFREGGLPAIGANVKGPIPQMTPEENARMMEYLKERKQLDTFFANPQMISPEAKEAFDNRVQKFYEDFPAPYRQKIETMISGPAKMPGPSKMQAGGEIRKFDNGGEIVGTVDGVPVTRDQLTEEQLKILQQR